VSKIYKGAVKQMDNKATTKRMIGAVVLVLVAALLLAWLLKGKNRESQEMAMNQPAETKPIIGFPGVEDQKPGLLNEDPNAAAQQGQNLAQNGVDAGQQNLNLEGSVNAQVVTPTGTDLSVRPSGNGTAGTGSVGAGDVAGTTTTGSTAHSSTSQMVGSGSTSAGTGSVGVSSSSSVDVSASAKDKPKSETAKSETTVTQKKSSAVLVGEHAVPKATSEESMRDRVAHEAAAKKAAADKAAAEKAAADKSKELASSAKDTEKAGTTSSSTVAVGGYAIQLMASADKVKAEAVAKPLLAEGYKVTVAEVKVDGKAIYRVRIGGYAKKDDAVAAQAKLKARYTQNPDVQNSFVTQ
jgi:cell division septation protein DedD